MRAAAMAVTKVVSWAAGSVERWVEWMGQRRAEVMAAWRAV